MPGPRRPGHHPPRNTGTGDIHGTGIHRCRHAHGGRQARRKALGLASGRSRGPGAGRAGAPQPGRPGPGRGRDHGLRQPGRPAGDERGAQRRAGLVPARVRARHHGGPAVRLLPAGPAFRGPGRDVGQHGHGDRRRRGEHVARAHGHAQRPARQGRPGRVHEPGHAAALSGRGVQPVHGRRDDGRQVRPDQGPAGRLCAAKP